MKRKICLRCSLVAAAHQGSDGQLVVPISFDFLRQRCAAPLFNKFNTNYAVFGPNELQISKADLRFAPNV
jgi:hypothetical protein